MAEARKFWNRIAKRYAKQPVADPEAYEKKLNLIRAHLQPGMKVLDFGCGTGSTAIALAGDVAHITAVDISDKMIEIARQKADEAGVKNITFLIKPISELATDKGEFDVVLGMSILHLVDDRDNVLAQVFDALKPGGVFFSSTACIGSGSRILRMILPLGTKLNLLPSLHLFTQDDLERSMIAVGFVLDHIWAPEGKGSVFMTARKPG